MRFETRYTYDFVKRFLPSECQRILEVGCGTGELATRLSKDGYSIVAIDSDPRCVAAARSLGVNAHFATWPDFDVGGFDAVLFTRSLHHIHPLGESIRRAANSLADGGRIIVEDFAYESVDQRTLRWFTSALRLLEATGALAGNDGLLERLLSKTETLKAWRQNHENDLHPAVRLNAEFEKTLGHVIREDTAYYFRYVANTITATEKREEILQAFAKQEEMLSTDGSIIALGRRFVAERAR